MRENSMTPVRPGQPGNLAIPAFGSSGIKGVRKSATFAKSTVRGAIRSMSFVSTHLPFRGFIFHGASLTFPLLGRYHPHRFWRYCPLVSISQSDIFDPMNLRDLELFCEIASLG